MKSRTFNNERGAILVVALIFVCVLTIAGSMAYRMTATELMIAKNFDSGREALYSAGAGLEEARAALGLPSTNPPGIHGDAIYDPATSSTSTPPYPDPDWTAYILATSWNISDDLDYTIADTNYIPNGSQTDTTITENTIQSPSELDYWVKIRHKTEYDAEQQGHTTSNQLYHDGDENTTGGHSLTDRGNVIVYGYPDGSLTAQAFTPSGDTPYRPIDIITAYGIGENSETTIRTEVAHDPGPPILAALYAETGVDADADHDDDGDIDLVISGVDNCASPTTLPPPPLCSLCGASNRDADIYLYSSDTDITPDICSNNSTAWFTLMSRVPPLPPLTSNIDILVDDSFNMNVNQGIISLKVWETSTDYSVCTGSPGSTEYNICSSAGDLTITSEEGSGVLLVQGNLTLNETEWNGLILVSGVLTLNGGANGTTIEGAVLVNGEVWINDEAAVKGDVTINYNSCAIDAALSSIPMKILSWEDLSITE
jgi:hypothetical protein